jgi:hypothetical protein
MKLKNIILSVGKLVIYCRLIFYGMVKIGKPIKTKIRLVIARGLVEEGIVNDCLIDKVSFYLFIF